MSDGDDGQRGFAERFFVEDDAPFPGQRGNVFRIVTESAVATMRKHGTTQRPHYIATVYSREYADHIAMLLNAHEEGARRPPAGESEPKIAKGES